jgi:D-alanyl-D-alanine carboxypeptidase
MIKIAAIFILLCLLIGGIYSGILPFNKSSNDFPKEEQQKINDVVKTYMDKFPIPGVIVGIWVPGKGNFIKGYGSSDIATNLPMDSHMSYRIASLTKTFVATVSLQLVDEGKINLDDPLSKYLPNSGIPDADKITIRELSNMTAGIFDYPVDQTFENLHAQNPVRIWKPEELIPYAVKHGPDFAPGTKYHYSNTNYILIGMVIEKVTGNSLASEIQNRIIKPLHLTHTYYATDATMPINSSHGYMDGPDGKSVVDATILGPSYAGAAGAIISNLDDMKIWTENFGKGTLISKNAYVAQTTWVDDPKSQQIKYGIGMMKLYNFVGHAGSIDGFNSFMAYDPKTGAVMVVMQNLNPGRAEGSADKIGFLIAKVVIPDRLWW